jgi:hypothetical protein
MAEPPSGEVVVARVAGDLFADAAAVEEQGDAVVYPGKDEAQAPGRQAVERVPAEAERKEDFLDRLHQHVLAPLVGRASAGPHRRHTHGKARPGAFVKYLEESLQSGLQPLGAFVQAALDPHDRRPFLGLERLKSQPDLVLDHLAG